MAHLYHGARSVFRAFDPYTIGVGAEPNSSLGVWLMIDPEEAVGYYGQRVLLHVETGPLRLLSCHDRETMIWGHANPASHKSVLEAHCAFAQARRTLMGQGYDGVWCEMPDTDLAGAVCIFDPAKLTIRTHIEHPEERDLIDLPRYSDDLDIDFGTCFADFYRDISVAA